MNQLDLFAPPTARAWLGETLEAQAQSLGWEHRCLTEMAEDGGSVVYCYPGFMGAHHERLVAKGFAERETLGPRPMPADWPHGKKDWASRAGTQHRYSITTAGAAELARLMGDA